MVGWLCLWQPIICTRDIYPRGSALSLCMCGEIFLREQTVLMQKNIRLKKTHGKFRTITPTIAVRFKLSTSRRTVSRVEPLSYLWGASLNDVKLSKKRSKLGTEPILLEFRANAPLLSYLYGTMWTSNSYLFARF